MKKSIIYKVISSFLLVFTLSSISQIKAQDALQNGWDELPTILSKIVPPTFPNADFNITTYGAVSGGTTLCTTAINNAIIACNAAGGGRVVIPTGTYLTGAIKLLSNVNLHISSDATLLFSTNTADYLPVVYTRFEGVECYNFSPFIYAYEQTNIAITGTGTLDGQASTSNWWAWKTSGVTDNNSLNTMGQNGTPVIDRQFGAGHKLRPNFVQPYKCKNVLIEGITVLRSPMWEIHPVLCENVTVRNITVDTHGVNNDGCNPECSKYVLIKDCTFNTGDDCIAIKSGRNNDGRRVNVPSEYIVIQGCTMVDGHGGVVIGSEISGSARNIYAEDCNMSSPNLWYALRLKTNSLRGGVVENIFMRNCTVGQVAYNYFQVDMNYQEGDAGTFTPVVQNIVVDNLTGSNCPNVFDFKCYQRSPISNFILKNSTLTSTAIGTLTNVRKLQINNTTVNGKVPLVPDTLNGYFHAEKYASKNNWGWSNVYASFSGNGYMEAVDVDNSINYNVARTQNENDNLVFKYANSSTSNVTCDIYVNQQLKGSVVFPPTASGWTTIKFLTTLLKGNSDIKLVSKQSTQALFIDRFNVEYVSVATSIENINTDVLFACSSTVLNENTIFTFTSDKDENVDVSLYNQLGQRVATLFNGRCNVGKNEISFTKPSLSAGVYFVKLQTSAKSETIKVIVQ